MLRKKLSSIKFPVLLFSLTWSLFIVINSVAASESPSRTYQFMWGIGPPSYSRMYVNITAPVYATPNSAIRMDLSYLFSTDITISTPGQRLEVSALLDNGQWQQVYYSVVLADGTYDHGTKQNRTAYVTVPSNAKLGSFLNVTLYTDYNSWKIYPTEIRAMNYDDLQSQVSSLQSQITSLQSQLQNINSQNTTMTSLALITAVAAVVFIGATIYLAARKPKVKTAG